jgi:uncharacterized protein (TIGR02145 family)
MAENLNFKIDGSYCYDDLNSNCKIFGRLYTCEAANKAAPAGWHLPTMKEYNELFEFLGGKESAWKKLTTPPFTALYGGWRSADGSKYLGKNTYGNFWSSSEYNTTYAWFMSIDNSIVYTGNITKLGGASVRCVKD